MLQTSDTSCRLCRYVQEIAVAEPSPLFPPGRTHVSLPVEVPVLQQSAEVASRSTGARNGGMETCAGRGRGTGSDPGPLFGGRAAGAAGSGGVGCGNAASQSLY